MPKLTGIALGLHDDGSLELVAASVAHGSGPTMWHAQQDGPNGDLNRPGDLGGSDPWKDAEPCLHSGSTPMSCANAR